MMINLRHQRKFFARLWIILLINIFICEMVVPAQAYSQALPEAILNLPISNARFQRTDIFHPVLMKGINLYREDPLKFDFIVGKGDSGLEGEALKVQANQLIKYFLAALTVPKDQLWVNLSPYEKNRIIPDALGKTEMGRDLLAQDYLLKQLTSSLMYPKKEIGKEFWERV